MVCTVSAWFTIYVLVIVLGLYHLCLIYNICPISVFCKVIPCPYINIYIRPLNSVQINCRSFCMNRTTFIDHWVGGVLVKTCIIALRRSTFLKEKQIHHVIKFSFLFVLTDLLQLLYFHILLITYISWFTIYRVLYWKRCANISCVIK